MCFPSYPVTWVGDLVFVYLWDASHPQSPIEPAGWGDGIFIASLPFSILTSLVDFKDAPGHHSQVHRRACTPLLRPATTPPLPGQRQPDDQHPMGTGHGGWRPRQPGTGPGGWVGVGRILTVLIPAQVSPSSPWLFLGAHQPPPPLGGTFRA